VSINESPSLAPSGMEDGEGIAGDRGASSLSRARSLQSRISNILAIGLI